MNITAVSLTCDATSLTIGLQSPPIVRRHIPVRRAHNGIAYSGIAVTVVGTLTIGELVTFQYSVAYQDH